MVVFVHTPGHPRPAVARHPDDPLIDAGVQLAALVMVGEEGVQVGQQAHGDEGSPTRPRAGAVPLWGRSTDTLTANRAQI
jgi:hypothetical protein